MNVNNPYVRIDLAIANNLDTCLPLDEAQIILLFGLISIVIFITGTALALSFSGPREGAVLFAPSDRDILFSWYEHYVQLYTSLASYTIQLPTHLRDTIGLSMNINFARMSYTGPPREALVETMHQHHVGFFFRHLNTTESIGRWMDLIDPFHFHPGLREMRVRLETLTQELIESSDLIDGALINLANSFN